MQILKIILVIGIIIFYCNINFQINAQQNLVFNPSFEDFNDCPLNLNTSILDTFNAIGWNVLLQTPDYFNICGSGFGNIQTAFGGGGSAQDGDAYIGEGLWVNYAIPVREYLQGRLNEPLISNRKYLVSLWVYLPDSMLYAVKNFGLFFSDEELMVAQSTNYYFQKSPQVKYTDSLFLNIRKKWMNISGSFIANGNEKFIAIGNFDSDNQTDTLRIEGGMSFFEWGMSYYYIDNVSVVEDTSYHPIGIEEEQVERIKLNYQVGNLLLQGLLFQNRETELLLYSYDGKQVGSYTLPKGNNSIPLKLPQGIYLYSLNIGDQALKRGKIWVGGE